jgi:hypothetical protein
MKSLPFDRKLEMCNKYGLSVVDVQTIFNNNESIEIFERLIGD